MTPEHFQKRGNQLKRGTLTPLIKMLNTFWCVQLFHGKKQKPNMIPCCRTVDKGNKKHNFAEEIPAWYINLYDTSRVPVPPFFKCQLWCSFYTTTCTCSCLCCRERPVTPQCVAVVPPQSQDRILPLGSTAAKPCFAIGSSLPFVYIWVCNCIPTFNGVRKSKTCVYFQQKYTQVSDLEDMVKKYLDFALFHWSVIS